MEVEGKRGGDVMGDDRLVHVHRPFRRAGGPAGEVQQGHVLRGGGRDVELRLGGAHERVEVVRIRGRVAGAHDQHVLETWEIAAHLRNPAPAVEGVRGDQHAAVADGQPLRDGFRAEGGKQRAEDAAVLQRAERGHVQLRYASG